jgi:hypothetical protein
MRLQWGKQTNAWTQDKVDRDLTTTRVDRLFLMRSQRRLSRLRSRTAPVDAEEAISA